LADVNEAGSEVPSECLVDGKYSIGDLVDVEGLRQIFEILAELTGAAIGFVSYPRRGNLVNAAWVGVCMEFHRANAESAKACFRSNASLADKMKKPGDICIEYCDNGLVYGGTPIIIKDKHIATLFAGQVFLQKPDIERFKKQAEAYGYDAEKYLEAVSKVKIVTEDRFKSILSLLNKIALWIVEQGNANLEIRNKNLELQDDVLYREKAEASIIHLNSILRATRSINQLIAKEKDGQVLLHEACRILVDSRNYRLVWIGLIEDGTFGIRPVAHAGFDDGYLEHLNCKWGESLYSQCPFGIAIRTKTPVVVNNIETDPGSANWRDEALRRGYRHRP